jgi:hypothetical protein
MYFSGIVPFSLNGPADTRVAVAVEEEVQEQESVDPICPAITNTCGIANLDTVVELAEELTATVLDLGLCKSQTNRYMANLKKIKRFALDCKIRPLINQINAFTKKVRADIKKKRIGAEDGQLLIQLTEELLEMGNLN